MMLSRVFSDMFDDMMTDYFPTMPDFGFDREQMKSDVREYDDHYDLSMELAGFGKEDIKAELENGYLTIQAVHDNTDEKKDDEGRIIRSERRMGSCQRSFYVGEDIKKEDITASYENGVLHLNIRKPALEAPKDQIKMIDIQ